MTRKDSEKGLNEIENQLLSEGDDEIDEFPVDIDETGWDD